LGERSYPIVFDAISSLGAHLKQHKLTGGRAILVSNSVVGKLPHKQAALEALEHCGFTSVAYVEIPDGEVKKTAETYLDLVNALLAAKADRKTIIIGLGGGVTTDIVGFAAATTLRGLRFVNVPTTLLAMVDASVGDKTGVNTSKGKNLLGAFWQPSLVLAPIDALSTLTDDEFRCGMGEVVKHAVLESKGFFAWLEANAAALSNRHCAEHADAISYAVKRCCEIKGEIVARDEREDGDRALLNLGHTVGHAIEHVLQYAIPHGVAVAIGTVAEAVLAEQRGEASKGLARRIAFLLRALGLPFSLEQAKVDVAKLLDAVTADKKMEGALITITVPRAIGDVRLVKVKPSELKDAFASLSGNASILDQGAPQARL